MSDDFDFLIGTWRVVNRRLDKWLCGSRDWLEFESHHEERRLSAGGGTVAYHQYVMGRTPFERNVVRWYNPKFDFWRIERLDSQTNLVMSSLKGTFWESKGSFLSHGLLGQTEVLVHVEWSRICDTFASWEQALSKDNGRTWETNWVMEFFRKQSKSKSIR